jgi:hypothetical protein
MSTSPRAARRSCAANPSRAAADPRTTSPPDRWPATPTQADGRRGPLLPSA